MVSRCWQVVWCLREANVPVAMLTCRQPGRIVYADEHQIAAVPSSQPRSEAWRLVR